MNILAICLLMVSISVILLGIYGLFQKKYTINCEYSVLCESIVKWGIDNIPPFNDKNKLSIIISSDNKNKMANYFPYLKKIEIYLNNHYNIKEVVESLLHEIVHYKQHMGNPKGCIKKYKKLLDIYGYVDHPMEIEANETAEKYSDDCLTYLKEIGLVI